MEQHEADHQDIGCQEGGRRKHSSGSTYPSDKSGGAQAATASTTDNTVLQVEWRTHW